MSPARSVEGMRTGLARPGPLDPGPSADLAVIEPAAIVPAGGALPGLPASMPPGEGPLSDEERRVLADCETVVDHAIDAWIKAGHALSLIRDGRLYRRQDRKQTFEQYAQERFGYSRPYAYQLIREWSVGADLSATGRQITERQARALVPVAERHGSPVAVAVYETVVEIDGEKVSAKVFSDAAAPFLEAEQVDPDQARAQVRAWCAERPAAPPSADPVRAFPAQADKLITFLNRTRDAGGTVPDADLEAARRAARRLTAALKEGGL